MRLIDADALAKFIDYGHLNNPDEKLYSENDIREMIDMMPVINVVLDFQAETPKHGHWDNKQIGEDISPYGAPYTIARCSVCRGKVFVFAEDYFVNYPYCPLCGAKMDEVTEDDTVRTV